MVIKMILQFKTSWRKRFVRAMKGTRRCRNKKSDSVDPGNNQEGDKDNNAVCSESAGTVTITDANDSSTKTRLALPNIAAIPTRSNKRHSVDPGKNRECHKDNNAACSESPCTNTTDANYCSPKKRRATPNVAYIPTNKPTRTSPPAVRYQYDTPPPRLRHRYSPPPPPKLEHCDIPIDIAPINSNLLLPALPSDHINSSYYTSGSRFRANPRLNWNIHSVSRQLRRSETTMSSLLSDDNFSPEDCSFTSITRQDSDCNDSKECTRDTATQMIRPTPLRGSAITVGSTAINLECDNVSFTNIMNEIPCCTWFNSSWASAFDKVEPSIQKKTGKK